MKFWSKLDEKYMKISFYVIGTFAAIMIIYQLINNVVPVMNWLFGIIDIILQILQPVLIGFAIAYLLTPVANYFKKQLSKVEILKKKAHQLSVVCALLVVLLVISGIVSLLAFSVTEQIRIANFDDIVIVLNKLISNVNELYKDIMSKLNDLNIQSGSILPHIEDITSQIFTSMQNGMNNFLSSVTNFSGYFVTVLISLIMAIYFMIDGKMVANLLKRITNVILSKRINAKIGELLGDMDIAFSGYIRGQLADVVFMMVTISITLLITGSKFAVLIGVLAGIGNLIPFMGPFIAYALTATVCLLNGDYKVLIISLIALSIIQFVDGNIVAPKLMSRSIKVHPLLVMVFLVVGSTIGGFMGMMLAVPVGSFAKLVFMKWLKKQETGKVEVGEGNSS